MKKFNFDADLYWSLPGPRSFVTRVASYAKRSRILCINLPIDLMPGTWEGVKKGLTDAHVGKVIDLVIRGGTDIAADIGVHFDKIRVTPEQLAGMITEMPSAVILRSVTDDARINCEKYAQEFMESITAQKGNIHLVIGFNEEGLRKDHHDNGIQVVVFDGALSFDEMDAYVALRMLDKQGPGSTRLTRMIVSEFAGYDVDFAEKLIALEEDRIINILDNLGGFMGDEPDRWRTRSWLHRSESLPSLGLAHVLLDRFLADHGSTSIEKDAALKRIQQRYWRACVKAITPWLEENRQRVIGCFSDQLKTIAAKNEGKISRPQADREVLIDPDELEYNNIVGMCFGKHLIAKTKRQIDALSVCKSAKNVRDDISHLRMPNPSTVVELIRKMDAFSTL
jgi:hypothetical protein